MKIFIIFITGFVGVSFLVVLAGTLVLNNRYDKQPEAKEFASGQFPSPSLDEDYVGTQFTGLGKNWLGKRFLATASEGINNFKGASTVEQRYPFQTSQQKDLRNKELDVLQLNYNYKDNPFWLRLIKDELVQVGPNKYLGKIHFKLGPLVIPLGYFRLEK